MINISTTTAMAILLVTSLNSSQIVPSWDFNYYFYNNTPVNGITVLPQITRQGGLIVALNLLGEQRNFMAEESLAYEQSLSKLFKTTGNKVF
jgi:hypothetical protein